MNPQLPVRGVEHDRLAEWVGEWRAQGTSFAADGSATRWQSEESVEWLPGRFFLLQRWNEHGAKEPFIGTSVIGFDPPAGYFIHSFENHGFYRRYDMTVEGSVWTISGATERARIEFTEGGKTQLIRWEFKPAETWQPLCERIALRVG